MCEAFVSNSFFLYSTIPFLFYWFLIVKFIGVMSIMPLYLSVKMHEFVSLWMFVCMHHWVLDDRSLSILSTFSLQLLVRGPGLSFCLKFYLVSWQFIHINGPPPLCPASLDCSQRNARATSPPAQSHCKLMLIPARPVPRGGRLAEILCPTLTASHLVLRSLSWIAAFAFPSVFFSFSFLRPVLIKG